jgi:hypothetical protein
MKLSKEQVLGEIHKHKPHPFSDMMDLALDPEVRGKYRRSTRYRPTTGKVKGMDIHGPVLKQKPEKYGAKGVYNALVSKFGSGPGGKKEYVEGKSNMKNLLGKLEEIKSVLDGRTDEQIGRMAKLAGRSLRKLVSGKAGKLVKAGGRDRSPLVPRPNLKVGLGADRGGVAPTPNLKPGLGSDRG